MGKKSSWPGLGARLIVLLVAMTPLSAWAGSATQPLMVNTPPILAACAVVSDGELINIRGRYDAYYFGMDIIINLTGSGALFSTAPHANMPPGTIFTPSGISFKDPYVTYQAGIGGQSIFQTVQVMGNGKMVTGVVNLDILVPRSLLTGSLGGVSLPKLSQIGVLQ
jgi:hypothetical protein